MFIVMFPNPIGKHYFNIYKNGIIIFDKKFK